MIFCMAKKNDTPEPSTNTQADIALLREAAEHIDACRIPHVTTEDSWTARPGSGYTKGHLNAGSRYRNLGRNLGEAVSWWLPQRDAFLDLIGKTSMKEKLAMSRISLQSNELSMPDAHVNGNLINWSEDAIHIALWSPMVTQSVKMMLLAEAEALETGTRNNISEEMRTLAQQLIEKKVWDSRTQVNVPTLPWWSEFWKEVGPRKPIRRYRKSMSDEDIDPGWVRYVMIQFAHLPKFLATRMAKASRDAFFEKVQNFDEKTFNSSYDLPLDELKAAVRAHNKFLDAVTRP